MNRYYLGIDTSNYRTSVALINTDGKLIAQKAVLLDVPEGKRGLRQSEAFFLHSNRLPAYIEELFSGILPSEILAIGVSERPRRIEGSYMPCFLAGVNAAREIAASLGIPLYGFSHQEGHAAAVIESGGEIPASELLFFHLSGGTTEALICAPDNAGYKMSIVGGTKDISIGQLLDRFGVAMGMPFPSGAFLDDMAYDFLEKTEFNVSGLQKTGIIPKLKTDDGYFNLSGAETRLMKYAADTSSIPKEHIAAELFAAISDLLIRETLYLNSKYGTEITYMAGGAASSRTFRTLVTKEHHTGIRFGDPGLSGDNAVGTALLAKRRYETGNSITGK